jgi:hypothetical protein
MEREMSLLKQAEKLQKNHEDSKVAEVASSIQSKLTQKQQKIDILRARLSTLENSYEAIKKVIYQTL